MGILELMKERRIYFDGGMADSEGRSGGMAECLFGRQMSPQADMQRDIYERSDLAIAFD